MQGEKKDRVRATVYRATRLDSVIYIAPAPVAHRLGACCDCAEANWDAKPIGGAMYAAAVEAAADRWTAAM